MHGVRAFRPITPAELAWQTDLGVGDPDYVELWWLDVALDNGWQLGIGMYRSRPYDGGRPAVTVNLLRPGEKYLEEHATFEPEEFKALPLGGRWGEGNELAVDVSSAGDPVPEWTRWWTGCSPPRRCRWSSRSRRCGWGWRCRRWTRRSSWRTGSRC